MSRTPSAGWLATLSVALLCTVWASPARAQAGEDQHEHEEAGPAPMVFRAFGAVEWDGTQRPNTPNSFALGELTLFMTSHLNERVTVVAEVVLEEGSTNTRVITDLERLQVKFRLNENLQVSAGRYHTGLGFYNSAFHHAAYFETPIGRPLVFHFEDEGGVLPIHEIGVSVEGAVPHTGSALHYLAEIGNGRLWPTPGDTGGEERDQNASKAVNVGLSLQPERWRGVEIGTSYYRDLIPNGSLPPVDHGIFTAYAVYRTPLVEVMGEWLQLLHRPEGGPLYRNDAGYIQASKAWGKIRPYYRYDRLAVDPGTPFIGYAGSYRAHIVGLRWEQDWVGLKAQYERTDEQGLHGIDSVRTQLVFVF